MTKFRLSWTFIAFATNAIASMKTVVRLAAAPVATESPFTFVQTATETRLSWARSASHRRRAQEQGGIGAWARHSLQAFQARWHVDQFRTSLGQVHGVSGALQPTAAC